MTIALESLNLSPLCDLTGYCDKEPNIDFFAGLCIGPYALFTFVAGEKADTCLILQFIRELKAYDD